MFSNRSQRFYMHLCLAILVMPQTVNATLAAPVTPYRPTVSNPAQMSAVKQLEMELGYSRNTVSDSQNSTTPYLLKYAFSPTWGLLMGGNGVIENRDNQGARIEGFGDTTVLAKHVSILNDKTACGTEFGLKIPTANARVGTGKADYVINAIYSKDMAAWHMDINTTITKLGVVDAGAGQTQLALAVAASVPITDTLGVTAEWSNTHQRNMKNTAQILSAVTYSPNKFHTFDVGLINGLTSASTHVGAFIGAVFPLSCC